MRGEQGSIAAAVLPRHEKAPPWPIRRETGPTDSSSLAHEG